MNIDDLTIGQAKTLASLFGDRSAPAWHPTFDGPGDGSGDGCGDGY